MMTLPPQVTVVSSYDTGGLTMAGIMYVVLILMRASAAGDRPGANA